MSYQQLKSFILKMKIPIVATIFMTLISLGFGGYCIIDNQQFKVGERYKPKDKCTQLACIAPKVVSGIDCSISYDAADDCVLVPADTSKPFPECCPTYDCSSKTNDTSMII